MPGLKTREFARHVPKSGLAQGVACRREPGWQPSALGATRPPGPPPWKRCQSTPARSDVTGERRTGRAAPRFWSKRPVASLTSEKRLRGRARRPIRTKWERERQLREVTRAKHERGLCTGMSHGVVVHTELLPKGLRCSDVLRFCKGKRHQAQVTAGTGMGSVVTQGRLTVHAVFRAINTFRRCSNSPCCFP